MVNNEGASLHALGARCMVLDMCVRKWEWHTVCQLSGRMEISIVIKHRMSL